MTNVSLSFEDIRKMRRGTNTYEVYPFPMVEWAYIGIRVLTQDEILKAVNTGKERAKSALKDPSESEISEYAYREMIFKATVKATSDKESDGESFFTYAEDVGELSRDELEMLMEHYSEVQSKYAPIQDLKTAEDFEALISELKKKPQNGMSLSTYTLRQLVEYLIVSSKTLPNDSDSISTPVNPSKTIEKENPTKESDPRGIKVIV